MARSGPGRASGAANRVGRTRPAETLSAEASRRLNNPHSTEGSALGEPRLVCLGVLVEPLTVAIAGDNENAGQVSHGDVAVRTLKKTGEERDVLPAIL